MQTIEEQQHLIEKHIDDLSGFSICDTHFNFGSKIHSSVFVYAKSAFQNSFYASRVAFQIVRAFLEDRPETYKKVNLFGYEMYSELLLGLIEKFLKDKATVTRNIIYSTDQGLEFTNLVSKKDFGNESFNLIIIPIASTGSTGIKIKDIISKQPALQEISTTIDFTIQNAVAVQDLNYENNKVKLDTKKLLFKSQIYTTWQSYLLHVPCKWYHPKDCPLCFGDKKDEKLKRQPLFVTDKTSLVPTLIFNFPNGRKIEKTNFDIKIANALRYKPQIRNNEHFLFSIDPEKLIEHNTDLIKKWLDTTRKDIFKTGSGIDANRDVVQKTDSIIILSPSHHTNTTFINMVNDRIFNSAATIFHFRPDLDYWQNLKLIYKNNFTQADHIFFVDDSLKSGNTFFKVYDALGYVVEYENKKKLSGSIFLSNKAPDTVIGRVVKASRNKLYSFNNLNLPNPLKYDGNNPLEFEQIRYSGLSRFVLHDVLKSYFKQKQEKTLPKKLTQADNMPLKPTHHVMFRATHEIYSYFQKQSRRSNSDLHSTLQGISFGDFIKILNLEKDKEIKGYGLSGLDIKISVLKVLSQYPFLVYKPLKQLTFRWHDEWLSTFIIEFNEKSSKISLEHLKEFKFLIRRCVNLDNYSILSVEFLEFVQAFLRKLSADKEGDDALDYGIFRDSSEEFKKTINTIHNFLLAVYVQMIYKNPWVATKLAEILEKLDFPKEPLVSVKFFRMLQIEVAAVSAELENDIRRLGKPWFNIYKPKTTSDGSNLSNKEDAAIERDDEKINSFLNKFFNNSPKLDYTEQCLVENEINREKLITYFWILNFLDNDANRKGGPSLKNKTEAVFDKIKSLFLNCGVFFMVADGNNQPHMVYDKSEEDLRRLVDFNIDESGATFKDFFDGDPSQVVDNVEGIFKKAPKTIDVFSKEDTPERRSTKWRSKYTLDEVDINILEDYNCLLVIRISDEDRFTPQGMIGVYSNTDLSENLEAKKLLMLLREPLGYFVSKHHKNQEFALLREVEQRSKFAYLAGHGRLMIRDFCNDVNSKKYASVGSTQQDLQLLFAISGGKTEFREAIKEKFTFENIAVGELKNTLSDLAKKIYLSEYIEYMDDTTVINGISIFQGNQEITECFDVIHLNFNKDLLLFIFFELITNAKKNKYYSLKTSSNSENSNYLKIRFNIKDNVVLSIEIENSSVSVQRKLRKDLTHGRIIKQDYEIGGVRLLNEILGAYDLGNVQYDFQDICRSTDMIKVTSKIKFNNEER